MEAILVDLSGTFVAVRIGCVKPSKTLINLVEIIYHFSPIFSLASVNILHRMRYLVGSDAPVRDFAKFVILINLILLFIFLLIYHAQSRYKEFRR